MKKDIEWIKNKLFEIAWEENKSQYLISLEDVYEVIDQLDPKQELPVIPKYIADWIEGYNWKLEKWKLPSTFRSGVKYKADQRLYEWANKKGNMDTFMKAILVGYEVEEEPKYIIDLDDEEISDGNHYLKRLEISEDGINYRVCDSLNAMTFESVEEAQLIADYVGGRVEELE